MSNGPATRLGMVRCEHCQRQFNPHSAARHIPWCKKQCETRKRHLTADKLEALERYRWRIGYRPSNLISNQAKNFAHAREQFDRTGQQPNRHRPSNQANHRDALRSYKRDEDENSQDGDEFSGDENSEEDNHHLNHHQSRPSAATQLSGGHTGKRAQNGSNSSATFSSPSASSITSLNNSVASTINTNKLNHSRANANQSRQQQHQRVAATTRSQQTKLVRSVSSVTINKAQGPGSASSRNSRVSAATIGAPDELHSFRKGRPQARQSIGATNSTRLDQMRAKSVSDLSNMGELVETLAKRMEEIYAQNQLLLDSIMRRKFACDNETTAAMRVDKDGSNQRDGANETDDDEDSSEFAQCHHCRVRCQVEANYCHKCGCKMRPSNPTPSTPE